MKTSNAMPESMTARVRIAELLDQFYARIDRSESIADLLTEQAEFSTPRRSAQGRQAFADLMLSLAASRRESGRVARHFPVNIRVTPLSDGTFRAQSLTVVLALDTAAEGRGALNLGDHDDVVAVDETGTYRFVRRAMTPVSDFVLEPHRK